MYKTRFFAVAGDWQVELSEDKDYSPASVRALLMLEGCPQETAFLFSIVTRQEEVADA